jgi:3-dehydroquinate synthase
MMGEAKLSQRLGLLNGEVVERQKRLLESFDLPTRCSGIDIGAVLQAMELDKKSREGQLRWVLLKGVGEVTIRAQVPDEEVIAVLEELVTGFKSKP